RREVERRRARQGRAGAARLRCRPPAAHRGRQRALPRRPDPRGSRRLRLGVAALRERAAAVPGGRRSGVLAARARAVPPHPQPAPEQAPATQPPAAQTPPPGPGENAPVVTEQGPRPPPDSNIQVVPGTPEEYTILKGDTLWDLSQKFLNNPWYWPKIWSLNPGIENPHWIYPGNPLKIRTGEGGKASVAQVEQDPNAEQAQAQAQADDKEQEAAPSLPSTKKDAP